LINLNIGLSQLEIYRSHRIAPATSTSTKERVLHSSGITDALGVKTNGQVDGLLLPLHAKGIEPGSGLSLQTVQSNLYYLGTVNKCPHTIPTPKLNAIVN
jgi:hypothetical protein